MIDDLKNHETEMTESISINYHGYDIHEHPPNGQGICALLALNILNSLDYNINNDKERLHMQIEAIQIAYSDVHKYITDINSMPKGPSTPSYIHTYIHTYIYICIISLLYLYISYRLFVHMYMS